VSELPLNYYTAYEWTGEDVAGEISIEGPPMLPVGSPHNVERYSPEHLLVVAAETCLANYVMLLSGLSKIQVKSYRSTSEGELMKEDKAGYSFKRILIRPVLTVEAGKESQGEKVLEKAHKLCLIARSLSCPVDMEARVEAG
jgi:organic hydroperoxide reductase OsmC/OhrA